MKTALSGILVAGMVTCGVTAVTAADDGIGVSSSLDIVSAYVFRGVTVNSGFVAQPGVEYSGLPVVLGVWGNMDLDDNDGSPNSWAFSEVDFYASYDLALAIEALGVGVSYTGYAYPGSTADADHEIALSLSCPQVPGTPSVSVTYGVSGAMEEGVYVEAGAGHELEVTDDLSVELSAALGYLAPDTGTSGLSHFVIAATANCGMFSTGLAYIGQGDEDVLGEAYQTEVTLSVGLSADF